MPVVRVLFSILLLCFAVSGCASKAALDDKATALTEALQKKDRAAFDALLAPGMVENFSPQKFETLAMALESLGPIKERNMRGIQVNGGVAEGNYTLVFEKGEVSLKVELNSSDRIGAFLYEGDALNAAADALLANQYAEFKVYEFTFLKDEKTPNPTGNQYKKGDKAAFGIILGGIAAKDGQNHVEVDLEIQNAKGKVIHKKEKFLNLQGEAGPLPKMGIYSFIEPPQPGNFQINFKFRDVIGGQAIDYGQAIVVTKN